MTQFKVGDKVRRTGPSGYGTVTGYVYTVASVDDYNWLRLLEVPDDDEGFHAFSGQNFELVDDFEAKYNALIADLITAFDTGNLYRFVMGRAKPEPKRFDVTVRVTEAERESLARDYEVVS